MPDSIDVTGSGNFIASEISNSTINATIVIGKSGEYRELEDKLNTLQKLFDRTPEIEIQERLEISEKIGQQKTFIESFKRDVLKLAETFERTELNTERLQKAKEHFDKGEITEARVLLEDAEEERSDNVARALIKQKESQEILQNAAAEYLILAQATALNFENPNRFEDTCRYYEWSIAAFPSGENVFNYAVFLHEHNQFHLAMKYYQKTVKEFREEILVENYLSALTNLAKLYRVQNELEMAESAHKEVIDICRKLEEKNLHAYLFALATTFSDLAGLNRVQNEYESATTYYQEALEIFRKLAEISHENYQPRVADVLNNLGIMYSDQHDYKRAKNVYKKALKIRRELAKKRNEECLSDVAQTLNNLGELSRIQNKRQTAANYYLEALKIRQELARKNPKKHLPKVAQTLNNIGVLHNSQKGFDERAQDVCEEALAIYRELAQTDPQVYLPDVAMALNNLANSHINRNNHEAAEAECEEALGLYRQLAKKNEQPYLHYVAMILSNLASLHSGRNQHDAAEREYQEAREISEGLAEKKTQMYLLCLGGILKNFAIFYQNSKPDKSKSIELALETVIVLSPFAKKVPVAQEDLAIALLILMNWGMSEEEIMAAVSGDAGG